MRGGRRVAPPPSLADARARAARELAALPPALRALAPAPPFTPHPSEALLRLAATLQAI
jgi:nicotinate phosphoribosyltransferase